MTTSSRSLAAGIILTIFSFNPGFAGGSFQPHFAPPHFVPPPRENMFGPGRFGPFALNRFPNRVNRFSPFFGAAGVSGPVLGPPTESAAPVAYEPVPAPSYSNTTIIIVAPQDGDSARPQAKTTSSGPKIITLDAASRLAEAQKTPTIIYGSVPGGQAY